MEDISMSDGSLYIPKRVRLEYRARSVNEKFDEIIQTVFSDLGYNILAEDFSEAKGKRGLCFEKKANRVNLDAVRAEVRAKLPV
jgi:hypothetical protein